MRINTLSFSSDGSRVAYGCNDGTVGILNLKTKKKDIMQTTHGANGIVSVQFNNNDSLLGSASIDGTVNVLTLGAAPSTAPSLVVLMDQEPKSVRSISLMILSSESPA